MERKVRHFSLGQTAMDVSEVGFGGIPIIRLGKDAAVAVLQRAFEQGINFYDTANAYADSEKKIGLALGGVRDKVVLATKTTKRDARGLDEHLANSLRMLQTDTIDLYQLHQVSKEQDWEQITGPRGALEAAQKAKQDGRIRYIGVTSHSLPMAIKMVKTGLFATIQFPFNFIEDAAQHELHAEARRRGVGILAMKPFAGGVIDNAAVAFNFLRNHPDVLPIPGFDAVEQVDEIVDLYRQPNVTTEDDVAKMDRYRAELGKQFCRRCEYCQPCEQGVGITMAMGYPVVVARMGPKVAASFCGPSMESVQNCTGCGECVTRCPYELPIPEMLKAHYDLYEQHRAQTA